MFPRMPIQQTWSYQRPGQWPRTIVFSQPDYFSLKKLLPSNWFPKHTIMGKILGSALVDPAGAALNQKALKAENETLAQVNKEYSNALTEDVNKIAQANAATQNLKAQANAQAAQADQEAKNKNILMIFIVVLLLAVSAVLIFKKKK